MLVISFCFFFNDTATTEIYTLSLHDALPILERVELPFAARPGEGAAVVGYLQRPPGATRPPVVVLWGGDRKSTRLNSSHANISYAVFCLKKNNNKEPNKSTLYSYTY